MTLILKQLQQACFITWVVAKSLNPLGYSIARMLKVLVRMALTKLEKLHFPAQRDHGIKMGKY